MMSTAVMVGEITASDWANDAGSPGSWFAGRNPCILFMAEASFVPALVVIVSPLSGCSNG